MREGRFLVCTAQEWGARAFDAALEQKAVGDVWLCWHPSTAASREDLERVCAATNPRYVFFPHWSQRVPASVFERWDCVNLHCTPLPYGRGGSPIENMILRGHDETVITAHQMTGEIDAGPIYGYSGPVSLRGTRDEILRRFVAPCAELMLKVARDEPRPLVQYGRVERFERLSAVERAAFWAARAMQNGTRA